MDLAKKNNVTSKAGSLPQKDAIKLDALLKLLFSLAKPTLIKLLMGVFGNEFLEEDVEISIANNEFVTEKNGVIRGDIFYRVEMGTQKLSFHIEFQLNHSDGMVIRLLQYGLAKGSEESRLENGTVIRLPHQRVIYFEPNSSISDSLSLTIESPDGTQSFTYEVPVLKNWDFTLDELVAKKMYPLLPLQIFNYRPEMYEAEKHPERAQEVLGKMKEKTRELMDVFHGLYDSGEIKQDDYDKFLTALQNLNHYFNDNFFQDDKFSEEVITMTTSVIKPLVEQATARGRAEGKAEGIAEGKAEGIAEGKAEGIAEGKAEGKVEGETLTNSVYRLLRRKHSDQSILSETGISQEKLEQFKENYRLIFE